MLLCDAEPTKAPPDDDDASEKYSKTLRLLTSALHDRAQFSAGTLSMISPALCGVRLEEVGTWAAATGMGLPSQFPCKAPRKGAPVKWRVWLNLPQLKLWEAVALMLDIEPTSLEHSPTAWMQGAGHGPSFTATSFPSKEKREQFQDAMRLAEGATSVSGPIYWRSDLSPRARGDVPVSLREVASFFAGCAWPDLPGEVLALTTGVLVSPAETKAQREDRRLKACEDAELALPEKHFGRLPDGIGKLAEAEGVKRQTYSTDVKAALKRREERRRAGGAS